MGLVIATEDTRLGRLTLSSPFDLPDIRQLQGQAGWGAYVGDHSLWPPNRRRSNRVAGTLDHRSIGAPHLPLP